MSGTLTIGYHYHIPVLPRNGKLYTPGYQGRFLEALAEHCKHIICFMHRALPAEETGMNHEITSNNLSWVDLGSHQAAWKRIMRARMITQRLARHQQGLDLMLLRGPTPLLPSFAARVKSLPLALLLVGDYSRGIEQLPQPGWKKDLIGFWASRYNRAQQKVVRQHRTLTFVNNTGMLQSLSGIATAIFPVKTTTLHEKDFFYREDTCLERPLRLLYAGRMSRTKGIQDIVRAIAILSSRGLDCELNLIGPEEKSDPLLRDMTQLASEKGIQNRVHYHGNKPVGEDLYSFYRKADLFINASISHEGFPRTIWEAMASSLPVITTGVGSISEMGKSAIVVVPPCQPEAIADSVERLVKDGKLRRQMIYEGRRLAKDAIMTNQVEIMVKRMEVWSDSHREKILA